VEGKKGRRRRRRRRINEQYVLCDGNRWLKVKITKKRRMDGQPLPSEFPLKQHIFPKTREK